jgi:hypothetical protein
MRGTNQEGRTRHAFNKLKRLLISVRDFQEALSAATFLLEEVDPIERQIGTVTCGLLGVGMVNTGEHRFLLDA